LKYYRLFAVSFVVIAFPNQMYLYSSEKHTQCATQQEIIPKGQDMDTTLRPLYIKKVEQRSKITVWVVDGTYVRTHLDEEFTNYGQHYGFKCIPKDEFWLD